MVIGFALLNWFETQDPREQGGEAHRPADEEDAVLEALREGARLAVQDERAGQDEAQHPHGEDRDWDRKREEQRMLDVQRHPEEEPSPQDRRADRVDAERSDRDRDRGEHEDERRRRGDEQLEDPLPPLPLDRAAGARARRRPDPHHCRPERGVEQ